MKPVKKFLVMILAATLLTSCITSMAAGVYGAEMANLGENSASADGVKSHT